MKGLVMNKKYKIGIDIGGTNTDAVLIENDREIKAAIKTLTTLDIHTGFKNALAALKSKTDYHPEEIKAIFMGTTHATNAILQCRDLYKVGVIRLAGQSPELLPPCYAWPQILRESIYAGSQMINGGFECHGGPITKFDGSELKLAATRLLEQGAESLAIIGVFSPIDASQEKQALEILEDTFGNEFPVSLSCEIGGIGFIERENSTILNAALRKVMTNGFQHLRHALELAGLNCPFYITQNNGSIISLDRATKYPVLTISAGPTNSFIGGTKLIQLDDAIVVDIGGTSTDVGVVKKGFPRRSLNKTQIGGVNLNFSMPNVLSIGLGGGSYVSHSSGNIPCIGPKSAGCRILEEALSFGGQTLTMTDIAIAKGHLSIPGACPERIGMTANEVDVILQEASRKITDLVASIDPDHKKLPVIMVGGGAQLFRQEQLDSRFIFPKHAGVANAFGAALAEISGVVDKAVSLQNRTAVLDQLQQEAIDLAVQNGATREETRVVDLEIIPYHYVPNNMARVVVTAAGPQK
jgi:N-methylhydantoinase A/oxoprolinase/acetone carboxylase beta subunit